MSVVSVNVARPKLITFREKTVKTGIFKEPVEGPVMIRTLGLEGDGKADRRVHGGPDKAVYGYPFEYYELWRREMGRTDLVPGQFGENLTLMGLPDEAVHIGDVFRAGDALLQATQPRLPCLKLGARMDDPTFPKRFMNAGRMGYYFRVLEEGVVQAKDSVERVSLDAQGVSISEVTDLWFRDRANQERIAAALRAEGLPPGWRDGFTERLEEARIAGG
ncbi:MAG: MOSC domain-containing protein [Gemmatimonadetes bacterium]|nr:MOSC domain-containing protein [Gemmatimonadota bacterium]